MSAGMSAYKFGTARWLGILGMAVGMSQATPVKLRCEQRTNPLGIDAGQPRLSWQSDSAERNWLQSAYQIVVASSAEKARAGKGDVWNSKKQKSDESVGIAYAGPPLESRRRYYWSVKVWDRKGHASRSEEAAWWEMGLLAKSDWTAQWIRWDNPEERADESGLRWVWVSGQDALHAAAGTVAEFRLNFDLKETPERVALYVMAHGDWKATANGADAGAKKSWGEFDRRNIGPLVKEGKNEIDISVTVAKSPAFGAKPHVAGSPGALAALVKITRRDGGIERIATSPRWEGRLAGTGDWKLAETLGRLDDPRFGTAPDALPQPSAELRREFQIGKSVTRARAYVTALGAYEMFLNGQRLGTGVLTPGFTDFSKRVQYQTYDVTGLLKEGANVAAATLGGGWYASGLSWTAQHFVEKVETRLLAQIEVDYSDGTHDTVITKGDWKAAESPVLQSGIYEGETYDARLEQPGWKMAGFDDKSWSRAIAGNAFEGVLSSQADAPPQVIQEIKPEKVVELPQDTYVFDMGQNMVGRVRLHVAGEAGKTVRLRFAEILNPDGSIYRENLRNADATDYYTLRGGGDETYTPKFTFHGFRYVEVTGYPGKPEAGSLTGEVVSSVSGEPKGNVTTSSDLVNRMWQLGIWGQRGNFLSVPTDCPQRDERLGWMADAEVFWRTGSYNFDIGAFTNKWMRDVRDAQRADGAFSNVSPNIGVGTFEGAPGWGDAGVIVPWTTWLQYGDRSAIERNWTAMEQWMKFIEQNNPDHLRQKAVGPDFADWLAPDNSTPKALTDTAYWALIADMMTQMAQATGRDDAARRYHELYGKIGAAFQQAYVKADGEVGSGSQTGYVLALQMKLLQPAMEKAAVERLVANIESHDWHLTTGFLGTPFLLFSLADHGRADVAYRLLLNETYPSWGYMLKKGATTWWERWNGDTGDPSMNSYNHYAFGSVVAWVYQCVAGIDTASSGPGFRQIVIQPRLNGQISEARGEYESVYGRIMTEWKGTPAGPFQLKVTIPANTRAKVILPKVGGGQVMEGGKAIEAQAGDRGLTVEAGSGIWEFEVK